MPLFLLLGSPVSLFNKADANFVTRPSARSPAGESARTRPRLLPHSAAFAHRTRIVRRREEPAAGKGGKALLTIPPSLLLRRIR